jgi:hypothetical protein
MIKAMNLVLDDVEKIIERFSAILEGHGIELESKSLTKLIERVEDLKTMCPNKEYVGLVTDRNGYIIKAFELADFVELKDFPKDFTRGYYKYEEGKFVLDEQRKRQLGGV